MSLLDEMVRHRMLKGARLLCDEDTPKFTTKPLVFNDLQLSDTLRIRQTCFDMNMRASETDQCIDMIVKSLVQNRKGKRNS
jgi:hypothetical protein